MSNFLPIPSYPGYSISPLGEVRSVSGYILIHAARGRVRLRAGKGGVSVYVGELLKDAGYYRGAVAATRTGCAEWDKQRRALDKARKANALLIGLRDDLKRRLTALECVPVPERKRGRPPKGDSRVPGENEKLDFDSGESWEGW